MAALPRVRPRSRQAWREWLTRHHATSAGAWLVYAKKHTKLPSLSYDEAVEEALCFGWIDSLVKSIDDRFHKQMFTPRKPRSLWSAANRARVTRLLKAGLMEAPGRAAVAAAKKAGTWTARAPVERLEIPPDLQQALDDHVKARRRWATYSASAQRSFLYMLHGAKRAETRTRRIRYILDVVGRGVSMNELRDQAMRGSSDRARKT